MDHGDYTRLAAHYHHRAGYSHPVLGLILRHMGAWPPPVGFLAADVGAGTGKLTLDLLDLGLEVVCVEPNTAMRAEGGRATAGLRARWQAGSGEATGLDTTSADWVLMGSSFHWTDPSRSLPEFHRVLRPGGHFTAIWNPREVERSPFHLRVEERIRSIVPELSRVSSGGASYTQGLFDTLVSTGHFAEVVLLEARHEVAMSRERYLGCWLSVNDIQVQAGPERWPRVLDAIREEAAGMDTIVTPYRSRAYTARRVDGHGD